MENSRSREPIEAPSARSVRRAELVERVRKNQDALRVVYAEAVELAAQVAAESDWNLGTDGLSAEFGHRMPYHLLEEVARISEREAKARIGLGQSLSPRTDAVGLPLPCQFPAVAEGFFAGNIDRDAAVVIVRELSSVVGRAHPDDIATAERVLVEFAVIEPADLVAVQARTVRAYLDPDGAEPRDKKLRRSRRFRIGREVDGLTSFYGVCDPVSAAILRAVIDSRRKHPKFSDPDETAETAEDEVANEADDRTPEQLDFDILFDVITTAHRTTDTGGARAEVIATIPLADLRDGTGAGYLDGVDEPVAASTIDTLACDGGVRIMVTGDHGDPLYLGTPVRLFSRAQRRALAARDGGCVWPLCQARAAACDAHHVIHYKDGGPTDIDNGVLVCVAHHHYLHGSGRELKMIDGRPHLYDTGRWRPLTNTRGTPLRT